MGQYYKQPHDCIDLFREEYWFLSNFYPAKLLFDGIPYNNSESAYQAQKLEDEESRLQFSYLYGDEAKRMGEKIAVRPDWEYVKLELMERILYAKFTQNPRLGQLLCDTGDTPLLEGNKWGDIYWGVDLNTHEGANHLGKLLMELREKFQADGIPDESAVCPVRRYGPLNHILVTDEDITQLNVDALVTDAEETLLRGDGSNMEIHRAAGEQLQEECNTLNGCGIGEAKMTDGYFLKAKHVIHTVSPVYGRDEENLLASCYRNCLDLAKANNLHSIAFPILATETHCFPKKKAACIAVSTIRQWIEENDYEMQVILSCIDHRIFAMVCEELGSLPTTVQR